MYTAVLLYFFSEDTEFVKAEIAETAEFAEFAKTAELTEIVVIFKNPCSFSFLVKLLN